ncbi:N-ATPase subunit AtpR [Pelagivirga sediminicola]|nr:ATP synthase subunit I [Pelagivirga sediminicola]
MLAIDWTAFALGTLAGSAAGAFYFAGLAWGVRLALGHARPMAVLLPSAALRIALLLIAGWWTAQLGAVALAACALAFLGLRVVFVAAARRTPAKGGASWS